MIYPLRANWRSILANSDSVRQTRAFRNFSRKTSISIVPNCVLSSNSNISFNVRLTLSFFFKIRYCASISIFMLYSIVISGFISRSKILNYNVKPETSFYCHVKINLRKLARLVLLLLGGGVFVPPALNIRTDEVIDEHTSTEA